jgi:hypothetical protein
VHEVADDEPRLDEGQTQQDGQHADGLHVLVGQVHLDPRHDQERPPDPEELRLSVVPLFFGYPQSYGYLIGFHA